MWPIRCYLKYGMQSGSVLREVLVRHEMCDMVRNDGVTWTGVWLRMSEMGFDVE